MGNQVKLQTEKSILKEKKMQFFKKTDELTQPGGLKRLSWKHEMIWVEVQKRVIGINWESREWPSGLRDKRVVQMKETARQKAWGFQEWEAYA